MIQRILLPALLLLSGVVATAQDEYLSTLNYLNAAVTPIGHIPGVTWVTEDNSAYDANHQRFFFRGNTTRTPPWYLFTIDATTGAILSNPLVPANNPTKGQVNGLQYDNTVDTLYAIYFDGTGNTWFSWIDIPTGTAHPKQLISGFLGYSGSTYDSAQHLYIVYGGPQLLTLDARTGYVVHSATSSAFNLVFDNANSVLYGISSPFGAPATFGSIDLITGTITPLTTLTVQGIPQINAYTIDEAAGNYIFVGTIPSVTNCVNYRLYTIDLNAARIADSILYPYAQDPSNPLDSNLIQFSFDNQRGKLYALNWRPTASTISPLITIAAAANSVCPGQADLFTATLSSPLANNNYQWLVNDQPVGTNSPTYNDTNPVNGDTIRCILIASTVCNSTFIDTSGPVVLSVAPASPTSLSITPSATRPCPGDTVVFRATSTGGGSNPQFQWLLNGRPAGSNSDTFSCVTLAGADSVACILQASNLACILPDTSGALIITVSPVPVLQMPPDTTIVSGQEVQLLPSIQGNITAWQWQPPTGLSSPSIADPIASPLNTTTYQLRVTNSDGCTASGNVTVKVVEKVAPPVYTALAMPNAFTPNGDGRNDVFRIPPAETIQLSRLSVFDRWGQQVFTTTNAAQGWNGTISGRLAPAGTYVWFVAYMDPTTGSSITQSGTVLLIR